MDDLDRILSGDGPIVPSAGFVSRVMDAVQAEAAAPPPIPFPWRRLLPFPAVALVAAAVWLANVIQSPPRAAPAWASVSFWLEGMAALRPLALPVAAVLLSLLLVEGSLRLAGARR